MATEMIYQMIECYQFSCQFAVTHHQNSLKLLWTDLKINSLTGFQNVENVEKSFKTRTCKWKGTSKGWWPPKGADKTHPGWSGQK